MVELAIERREIHTDTEDRMSYKNTARAAEYESHAEQSLMCRAHGCPLKWSVQTGDVTACSFHAWVDVGQWPRITEDIRSGRAGLQRAGESVTVADMKSRMRGSRNNISKRIAA